MVTRCSLCKSPEIEIIDSLSATLLSGLYKSAFGIDVGTNLSENIALLRCGTCDLRFYAPGSPGDESFYEDLQRFDWYYLSDKQEYEIAAEYIGRKDSLLEVGAGRGAFAKKIECGTYLSLELSEAAVEMARRDGIRSYRSTVEKYAEQSNSCHDVVCSFQVLEHVPDPHSFLAASVRCLKLGGMLIQSVPSEDAFLGHESNNILNMPPHHMTRWTDKALRNVGKLFSLELVDIRHDSLDNFHVVPYSVAVVQGSINTICGRRPRSLDRMFACLPMKAFVKSLSVIFACSLKRREARPWGHSVTAIYRKV